MGTTTLRELMEELVEDGYAVSPFDGVYQHITGRGHALVAEAVGPVKIAPHLVHTVKVRVLAALLDPQLIAGMADVTGSRELDGNTEG